MSNIIAHIFQVANVLDCNIIVSSNSSQAITLNFELISLNKGRDPLISQQPFFYKDDSNVE